jgi:hypothetical protein
MNAKNILAVLLLVGVSIPAWSQEEVHSHHLGAAVGGARHDGKSSAYLGLDYVYRFQSSFALGVFHENVSGDFNINAYGLTFGKFFDNGFKFGVGPGVEKKIEKDKTLFLFHVTGGYDWHSGRWSYGPIATIDFIEDSSNTFYVGFSVGYGF